MVTGAKIDKWSERDRCNLSRHHFLLYMAADAARRIIFSSVDVSRFRPLVVVIGGKKKSIININKCVAEDRNICRV